MTSLLLTAAFVAAAVWFAGSGPPAAVPAIRTSPSIPTVTTRAVTVPAQGSRWRSRLVALTQRRVSEQPHLSPDTVAVLADRLGALLRSGLGEDQAWQALAERDDAVAGLARTVVGTRSLGGDTAEGLRRALGRQPGGPPGAGAQRAELAWLALAWEVSQVCGAPLTGVLEGIAATIRAEADADRARRTALAGPRATASVLTWLPAGGLGLGLLLGADVLEVLFTTSGGRLCLVVGIGLWWVGRAWTARLLRRAAAARA